MAVIAEDVVCPVGEATACRALWATVLLACLRDAARDPRDQWLGTADFYTVASLAGIEAEVADDLVSRIRAGCTRLSL